MRSVRRYVAPLGLVVLALSTACAPVTGTAHLSTVAPYAPADAPRHEFVVDTGGFSFESDEIMASKLEVLFEGQRLAVDSSNYSSNQDVAHSDFSIAGDSPMASGEMPAEILVSVASGLGIMSELADGGLLLASAGNLFGESGDPSANNDQPPVLASLGFECVRAELIRV
jgi:hypothetical protein